ARVRPAEPLRPERRLGVVRVEVVGLRDEGAEPDVVLVPPGVVPRLVVPAGRPEHRRVALLLADHDRVRGAVADVGDGPPLVGRGAGRAGERGPLADEHALLADVAGERPAAAVAGVVAPGGAGPAVGRRLAARRAVVDLDRRRGDLRVDRVVEHVRLLDVRGELVHPRPADPVVGVAARLGRTVGPGPREPHQRVVVVVQTEPDLLEVVHALAAGGRLPDLLDRGKEQADQDGDDGNDDQQLDQGEPPTSDGRTDHNTLRVTAWAGTSPGRATGGFVRGRGNNIRWAGGREPGSCGFQQP